MKQKEKAIADKEDINNHYPKWDKDRNYWVCSCGKQMIPRPFKLWKDKVIDRMYKLRKQEHKEQAKEIFEDIDKLIEHIKKDWNTTDSPKLQVIRTLNQLKQKHTREK